MAEEIVIDIRRTESAKISFYKIAEYLKREWSENQIAGSDRIQIPDYKSGIA